MPARLKVFRATLGFYEAVVAAPSQAAALKAWGVREALFQHGAASTTDDPAAVEPALAQPGVVLRRAVGGSGAFQLDPDLPAAPALKPAASKPAAKRGKAAAPAPPPKPKPDRSALDAAERAVADAEAEFTRAQQALDAERVALDARQARLEREQQAQKRELEQALKAARRVYVRAGGEA